MPHQKLELCAFLAAVLLAAASCGGGGGGGSTTPAPTDPPAPPTTPPTSDADPAGVWKGTFSHTGGPTSTAIGFISANGEFRLLFPDSGAQYFGPVSASGNSVDADLTAVAAPGQSLGNGNHTGEVQLEGEVEQQDSLTGDFSGSDGDGTFELTYVPDYEGPTTTGALQGAWSADGAMPFPEAGQTDALPTIGIDIGGDGRFAGGDTFGCDYEGSVSASSNDFSVFPVSVNVSSCGGLNGTYDGIVIPGEEVPAGATLTIAATLPTESMVLSLSSGASLSPAGNWTGTAVTVQGGTQGLRGIVSEDDVVHLLRDDGEHIVGTAEVTGNFLKVSGEVIAPDGGMLADGSERSPVELRARISERKALVGRGAGLGEPVAIELAYDDSYEAKPGLQGLAGQWTLTGANNGYVELDLDEAGLLFGAGEDGCNYYGRVEQIDVGFNAFRVTLDSAGCGQENGALEGLLALDNPGTATEQLFLVASGDAGTMSGVFDERAAVATSAVDPGVGPEGSDVSDSYANMRLSTVRVVTQVEGEEIVVPLRMEPAAPAPVLTGGDALLTDQGARIWAADQRFGNAALRIDFASPASSLTAQVRANSDETVILQLYDAAGTMLSEAVVARTGQFPVRVFNASESDAWFGIIAPAFGAEIAGASAELAGGAMPQIDILSPADGARFEAGEAISFQASAFNAAGQPLASSIEWTSSIEVSTAIGSGASFTAPLQEVGVHTIEAVVTDAYGLTAADSITVVVEAPQTGTPAGDLPNVLLFLSDDIGYGDVGVYNPQSQIPTPSIDALAEAGMRFMDAHAPASKCAPTRYATLTGNYQWRGRRKFGIFNYKGGSQVLPGQWTIGTVLQEKGYETAFIGKVHLGGDFYRKGSNQLATFGDPDTVVDFSRPMMNGPLSYGFSSSYLLLGGIQASPYAFFRDDRLIGNADDLIMWDEGKFDGSQINNAGIGMPDWDSREAGPKLVAEALAFIDRHHTRNQRSSNDRPFFLLYNSQSAHAPYTPPDNLLGVPIDGVLDIDSSHAHMIYEADVALGLMMQSLKDKGLLENTIVIFTSDNGGTPNSKERSQGHDSSGGLRGRKREAWEGGHRVPLVVRWGDGTSQGSRIPPGRVRNQMIGLHDFMATISSIVGHPLPADQASDSFDFSDVLLGNRGDAAPVRDHMILQGDKGEAIWAYREGKWKLVMGEDYSVVGLFDLDADIGEQNDLQSDSRYAQRVADMHARFLTLRGAGRTAPLN